MSKCDLLDKCGFFQKHQKSSWATGQGFITPYRQGPRMDDCIQQAYLRGQGTPPPDDLLPGGQTLKT
jgi:hypothetical protein